MTARGIEACGKKASVFECSGTQVELWPQGTDGVSSHRAEVVSFCMRSMCPDCGENKSVSHNRRADRLFAQLWGMRIAKWVITVPPEYREELRDKKALGSAATAVAKVVDAWNGGSGAKVAVHFRGEPKKGDRWHPHFEVLIPHDGRKVPQRLLDELKEAVACAMGWERWPVADFQYISTALTPEVQVAKWKHKVSYAVHPTCGALRFLRLPAREAFHAVEVSSGFRICRGVGLLGDRKIKKWVPVLRRDFPMPDVEGEGPPVTLTLIKKNGPCPCCTGTLRHIREDRTHMAGGREISPGVFVHELVREKGGMPCLTFAGRRGPLKPPTDDIPDTSNTAYYGETL